MSSATLEPCLYCTQVLSTADTRRDQFEVLSGATKKRNKKASKIQKLNLIPNISEIGNAKKRQPGWKLFLKPPSVSWYFCHSIWEVLHGSGPFSNLPVLLEQSCNELMAFTVPWPSSQWISPRQYESSNHPQTKLINSAPQNIDNQDFYRFFPSQITKEEIGSKTSKISNLLKKSEPLSPKKFPMAE